MGSFLMRPFPATRLPHHRPSTTRFFAPMTMRMSCEAIRASHLTALVLNCGRRHKELYLHCYCPFSIATQESGARSNAGVRQSQLQLTSH